MKPASCEIEEIFKVSMGADFLAVLMEFLFEPGQVQNFFSAGVFRNDKLCLASYRTTKKGAERLMSSYVINQQSLLQTLDGDLELFVDLIQTFIGDAPRYQGELEDALRTGDRAGVARIAHALKGSASNVRAEAVAKAAAEIETLAATGELERISPLVANLRSDLAAVAEFLNNLK